MTDGVFGIGYGQTSGVGGGYVPQKKDSVDEKNANEQQQANANQERKDVKPDDILKFMAANTYFVPVKTDAKQAVNPGAVDAETQKRVEDSMKNFEELFSIVEQEVGAEYAPSIFDSMMNKLLGMDGKMD